MSTEHERWVERISAYLDGELEAGDRERFERHLAECASCRETVDDVREVVARAGTLADHEPADDLWAGIEARLDDRAAPAIVRLGRRYSFSLPQLAAAAALLVAVTGAGTWVALRSFGAAPGANAPSLAARTPVAIQHPNTPTGGNVSAPGVPESGAAPSTTAPAPVATLAGGDQNASGASSGSAAVAEVASFDERRYDQTIAQLQDVIRMHQADLDTSTVRIVEQNLALIDRAIADARHALLSDPGNPYLNGHLAQQLQRKVHLLQQATDLVAAQKS